MNQNGPALQPGQPMPATPRAMDPSAERGWGMISHAVALTATVLSGGLLGFVGALAVYLIYKDRGPFVRAHAANAVNVQIMAGIIYLVSFPLMAVLIGFLTYPLAWIFAVVLHIVGAIKANNGEWWDPPLTPRFVR